MLKKMIVGAIVSATSACVLGMTGAATASAAQPQSDASIQQNVAPAVAQMRKATETQNPAQLKAAATKLQTVAKQLEARSGSTKATDQLEAGAAQLKSMANAAGGPSLPQLPAPLCTVVRPVLQATYDALVASGLVAITNQIPIDANVCKAAALAPKAPSLPGAPNAASLPVVGHLLNLGG